MPSRTFRPTAETSMCHVRLQSGTNLQENTYAFHWSGSTPSIAELLALATALAGTVGASLRALTSTNVTFREVYCRNIDTEVANEATYTFPVGTTGQRSGNQVAANEACGVVKRTGQTGRGSHGRNSISNFVESDVDGNSVLGGLMALLANLAISTVLDYFSGRFRAAIAHIPRNIGVGTSTPITTAIVIDSNIDSQKTRLNNHGR